MKQKVIIVKPKQAGICGRSIRNEHMSKSLICSNIKYYRINSIYSLSRLYAILLSIAKKQHVNGNLASWMILCAPPTSASLFWFYYSTIFLFLERFYCSCFKYWSFSNIVFLKIKSLKKKKNYSTHSSSSIQWAGPCLRKARSFGILRNGFHPHYSRRRWLQGQFPRSKHMQCPKWSDRQ